MLRDGTILRRGKGNAFRYADSWSPRRQTAAGLKPGSPRLRAVRRFYAGAAGRRGGGPATAERRQGLLPPKPLSGVHFGGAFLGFLLRWVAGAPPGASGPPLCRVFTVQWGRIGVPHANRATWVSNVPRFCGPAGPKPRAARETDDLDPQRTDKTQQIRRTRLQFLDSVSLFAARGVESP